MGQELSTAGRLIVLALQKLPQGERSAVVDRAEGIRELVIPVTPEKRTEAQASLMNAAAEKPTTKAGDRFEIMDNHVAVVGKISVRGTRLDTLLSEGSFNKTRADQIAYAETLGYRLATREEHRAYVESLIAKEKDSSINLAESNALETYRKRFVWDNEGGLAVYGLRVHDDGGRWLDMASPDFGALFVRASA